MSFLHNAILIDTVINNFIEKPYEYISQDSMSSIKSDYEALYSETKNFFSNEYI